MGDFETWVYGQRYDAYLVGVPDDEARLRDVQTGLELHGCAAMWDSRVNAATVASAVDEGILRTLDLWQSPTVVALWSENADRAPNLVSIVEHCVGLGMELVLVACDATPLPPAWEAAVAVRLAGWSYTGHESVGLLEPRVSSPGAAPRSPPLPTPFSPLARAVAARRSRQARAPTPDQRVRSKLLAKPSEGGISLGVAAPRSCGPGETFVAHFAAYVDELREQVRRQLEALAETGDRLALGVSAGHASRWKAGAPVSVSLAGDHVSAEPATQQFEFNGTSNLLSFAVRVDSQAPATAVLMAFKVELAGVPVGFVPLRLTIRPGGEAMVGRTEIRVASSAFASYSSRDSDEVLGRLSTLSRWQPDLDIFVDCLDLIPNEAFKPVLQQEIVQRDLFLLFWSRNAAASPWVRWELATAMGRADRYESIMPMPLEDPSVAPWPEEFADRHQRDRYLVARYGLDRMREELAS
jgi:hypothetical protein